MRSSHRLDKIQVCVRYKHIDHPHYNHEQVTRIIHSNNIQCSYEDILTICDPGGQGMYPKDSQLIELPNALERVFKSD